MFLDHLEFGFDDLHEAERDNCSLAVLDIRKIGLLFEKRFDRILDIAEDLLDINISEHVIVVLMFDVFVYSIIKSVRKR